MPGKPKFKLTPDDQFRISCLNGDLYGLLTDYERGVAKGLAAKNEASGGQLGVIDRAYNSAKAAAAKIPDSSQVETKSCNRCGAEVVWLRTHGGKYICVDPTPAACLHAGAGVLYIRDRHIPHRCKGESKNDR